LKGEVTRLSRPPRLAVITCAPNFETSKFLNIKMRKAREVGIGLSVIELPYDTTTEDSVATIMKAAESSDGIVVQLPFPAHVDPSALIDAIPKTHDVDAFNLEDGEILPPVVGAMKEILSLRGVEVKGKRVTVIGRGKLVGAPAAAWFLKEGADVTVVTEANGDISQAVKEADILVLGVGKAGLITPDMVQEGVVILDAGTSESAGELKGDADPLCAEKASLFTPVPGGVGPITVAVLLRNLVLLHRKKG
jgi:methylenetetrahydrofolate dehydrogenase (NADP+)/methenyltetrahydrofolate cyclohydrolase